MAGTAKPRIRRTTINGAPLKIDGIPPRRITTKIQTTERLIIFNPRLVETTPITSVVPEDVAFNVPSANIFG